MNTQMEPFTQLSTAPRRAPQKRLQPVITPLSMDVGADAIQLLKRGDFNAARARIKSLRFTHATAPEGYLLFIMVTYAKQDNARMALRYARQVLLANPTSALAITTAAEMLSRLGSLDEAEQLAGQLIREQPKESGAWTTLAVVAARRGNREEAIANARQALTIRPNNRLAAMMLSTLLFDLDRHADAVPVLQRILKRAPEDHEARFMLGSAQHATCDYAGAIRSFRRTLSAERLDEETRIAALSHIVSGYLCLGNLKRYGEYVVQLASRYGYDPDVHQLVEVLEAQAAEVRRTAADPTVRRLDNIYKVLMRSKSLVEELHALNAEIDRVWNEIAPLVRRIRVRPMNSKVSSALAAVHPTLHEAAGLEAQSNRMFEELDTIVSTAADCSSAFTPSRFLEHLAALKQCLLQGRATVREGHAAVSSVVALQTQQLGH